MCWCLRPFPLLNAPVRNWQLGEERRGGEGTARDGIIIGPQNEGSEAGVGEKDESPMGRLLLACTFACYLCRGCLR